MGNLCLAFVLALALIPAPAALADVTIVRVFVDEGELFPDGGTAGPPPGNASCDAAGDPFSCCTGAGIGTCITPSGGGNLQDVFDAASDTWELAIDDAFTVTLHYGWSNLGTAVGAHNVIAQGGNPHRETVGMIRFNNDLAPWFADLTPLSHTEYGSYATSPVDVGGGSLNKERCFGTPNALALDRWDLLTVARHEIGHALGLSVGNDAYIAEAADNTIDVTVPRSFPGSSFLVFGAHFVDEATDGSLMEVSGVGFSARCLLSAADMLAVGQVSLFTDLMLHLDQIPVLSKLARAALVLLLALTSISASVFLRRRKFSAVVVLSIAGIAMSTVLVQAAGKPAPAPALSMEWHDSWGRGMMASVSVATDGTFEWRKLDDATSARGPKTHATRRGKLPPPAVAALVRRIERAAPGPLTDDAGVVVFRWVDASGREHVRKFFEAQHPGTASLIDAIERVAMEHGADPA